MIMVGWPSSQTVKGPAVVLPCNVFFSPNSRQGDNHTRPFASGMRRTRVLQRRSVDRQLPITPSDHSPCPTLVWQEPGGCRAKSRQVYALFLIHTKLH